MHTTDHINTQPALRHFQAQSATDSRSQALEQVRHNIANHTAAFLKHGGKIQQIPSSEFGFKSGRMGIAVDPTRETALSRPVSISATPSLRQYHKTQTNKSKAA